MLTSSPTPQHATPAAVVTRGSKLDLLRMIAADIVWRIDTADDGERMSLVVQLKNLQDQIATVKHRVPLIAERPSRLSWVDIWAPA